MKIFNILIVFVLFNYGASAFSKIPINNKEDIRIETVNEHAFFILTLDKNVIKYGDKVELIFGLNHKIEAYNLSGSDIHTFSNPDELVVLIAPEDLRCFRKKSLRKVKMYTDKGTMTIKANIGPNHVKIK